jgi:hypothetical protein
MPTTIVSSNAKRQSLAGLMAVLIGALLFSLSMTAADTIALVGKIVGALLFGLGFLIALRTRCANCGRCLSAMFPGGSLLVLWAAQQRCRNCNQWL